MKSNRDLFNISINRILNLAEVVTRIIDFDSMKPETIELNAQPVIGILAQARDFKTH